MNSQAHMLNHTQIQSMNSDVLRKGGATVLGYTEGDYMSIP